VQERLEVAVEAVDLTRLPVLTPYVRRLKSSLWQAADRLDPTQRTDISAVYPPTFPPRIRAASRYPEASPTSGFFLADLARDNSRSQNG
jgi:hypothetical protein